MAERQYEDCYDNQNGLIRDLRNKNKDLQTENDKLKIELRLLKTQMKQNIKKPVIDKDVVGLIKTNCELEARVKQLREDNRKLKVQNLELERLRLGASGEKEKKAFELARVSKKAGEAKEMNMELKAKIKSLRRRIKGFEGTVKELERECFEKDQKIREVGGQVKRSEQKTLQQIEHNKSLVQLAEKVIFWAKIVEKVNSIYDFERGYRV